MSTTTPKRYIVVSPMRNEEKYVTSTLKAMTSQTLLPVEWVIINDGSTDASAEIVASYSERYPWIRLVNADRTKLQRRARGARIVDLIYEGLSHIQTTTVDFIVKLDCDLSIQPTFFETVCATLEANPRLGVTSGVSYTLEDGVLREEKSAPRHTLGATKIYRRECFEAIGGIVPAMGWDGIDEIKARMHGWDAWPIRSLVVLHHRPEGAAMGMLTSGVERGKGSHFMGYHPLFLLARAIRRLLQPKFTSDGIGMLIGYFGATWRKEPQIDDVEFIRFIRKNQLRKLTLRRNEI